MPPDPMPGFNHANLRNLVSRGLWRRLEIVNANAGALFRFERHGLSIPL